MQLRNLVVVLDDQLDGTSSAFTGFDPQRDRIWMAESPAGAGPWGAHKARIGLRLAAMRHFRHTLEAAGLPVMYRALGEHEFPHLDAALTHDLIALRPWRVVVCEPSTWGVRKQLQRASARGGAPLEIRPDRHFLCSLADFARWAQGRESLRIDAFYRFMRRRTGVLMDGERPAGGRWELDGDARRAVDSVTEAGAAGFAPDATTWGALARVKRYFPDNPGSLERFDWPVDAGQARQALAQFVAERLPQLRQAPAGDGGAEARLSAALNLKLLDPRTVLDAALTSYGEGRVPLGAVERLVRELIGWREFLRGLYWQFGPEHPHANALGANRPLPGFYWDGQTDMACLRETLGRLLENGYTAARARFAIAGLFAFLLGVHPLRVQEWNLALAVDAAEWMERPITLGPSQFADAGRWASTPYLASGRHIQSTTPHCRSCRYRPQQAVGDDACPFTTLYWDFLARHRRRLPPASSHLRDLEGVAGETLHAIRRQAAAVKVRFAPIRAGLEPG